ncbi:MAG: class II aldolase/adducin family protein [bacterium]
MKEFKEELKDIAGYIFSKDLSEGASGNISFRDEPSKTRVFKRVLLPVRLNNIAGFTIAITTSGSRTYELMRFPEKYISRVRVRKNGSELEILDSKKPSSEILCHLLAYNKTPATKAILHVHPKYSLALSDKMSKKNLNKTLDAAHTEFKYYFPQGIGLVERMEPGTLILAEKSSEEMKKYNVVLWKNHGLISRGDNLYECYDSLETVESISKIALLSGKLLES